MGKVKDFAVDRGYDPMLWDTKQWFKALCRKEEKVKYKEEPNPRSVNYIKVNGKWVVTNETFKCF